MESNGAKKQRWIKERQMKKLISFAIKYGPMIFMIYKKFKRK